MTRRANSASNVADMGVFDAQDVVSQDYRIARSVQRYCSALLLIICLAWLNTFPSAFDSETAAVGKNPVFLPLHGTVMLMVTGTLVMWPKDVCVAIFRNISWFIILLWCCISTLWSVEPVRTFLSSIYIFYGVLGIVVCQSGLTVRQLDKAIRIIAMLVCLSSLAIAIGAPNYGLMNTQKFSGQLRGIYNHKNLLAAFAGLSALWCYGYWRAGQRKNFVSGYVLHILIFIVLLMSWSATMLLSVAISVFFCEYLVFVRLLTRNFTLRLILLLLFILFCIFSISVLVPVVLDFFQKDLTLSGRTYIWSVYYTYIAMSPWTGAGYNAAVDTSQLKVLLGWDEQLAAPSAHNSFLQLGVGVGIPMTVILVVLLMRRLYICVRGVLIGEDAWFLLLPSLIGFLLFSTMEASGGFTSNIGLLVIIFVSPHILAKKGFRSAMTSSMSSGSPWFNTSNWRIFLSNSYTARRFERS